MTLTSRVTRASALLATVVLVAACSSSTTRFGGPPPAAAYPAPSVTSQQLPPPISTQPVEQRELAGEGQQMAAIPQTAARLSREDVLGQWNLSGSEESCQVFVALTSWQGGYRASSRNCRTPEFSGIGAWNIESNLVVLKDNDGNAVARLARSGATRFDGRTELGSAVTMSR